MMLVQRMIAVITTIVLITLTILPSSNSLLSGVDENHIVFVSVPLTGHVNPLLPPAAELAKRGWKVSIATSTLIESHINQFIQVHVKAKLTQPNTISMSFMNAGDCRNLSQFEAAVEFNTNSESWHDGMALFGGMGDLYTCMWHGLTASFANLQRPKLFVIDVSTTFGIDFAEKHDIPFMYNNADLIWLIPDPALPVFDAVPGAMSQVSIHDPGFGVERRIVYPFVRLFIMFYLSLKGHEANAERIKHGLPYQNVYDKWRNKMIIINGAWGIEYPRPVPPLVQMVGPMIVDEDLAEVDQKWLEESEVPVVFVSFGTITALNQRHVRELISGFESPRYRVLWKLKPAAHAFLPANISSSIKVVTWTSSQIGTLKHINTKVFVSHCGINSVYESLYHTTPVLCIPMFADQIDMAHRLVDTGCGTQLYKHTFTGNEVREALHSLLDQQQQPTMRANLLRARAAIAVSGGAGRAADIIEHTALYGVDHIATADTNYPWWAIWNIDVYITWFIIIIITAIFKCCCCKCCYCCRSVCKSKTH